MVKNHHLAKSISDAGWYSFSLILAAKAEIASLCSQGRKVVKVDPKFTSQVCSLRSPTPSAYGSGCGAIVKKELKDRWHSCDCGCELHRDVNAAINILTKANITGRERALPAFTNKGSGRAFGDRICVSNFALHPELTPSTSKVEDSSEGLQNT
jgi:transposase